MGGGGVGGGVGSTSNTGVLGDGWECQVCQVGSGPVIRRQVPGEGSMRAR